MMDLGTELLIKQFKALPQNVQVALASFDFRKAMTDVASRCSLRADQAGAVEEESMYVLLGMESPDNFVRNLERHGAISTNLALVVSKEVNEKIFMPVRELVLQNSNTPNQTAPKTVALPQTQKPQSSVQQKLESPSVAPRETQNISTTTDPYREPTQ